MPAGAKQEAGGPAHHNSHSSAVQVCKRSRPPSKDAHAIKAISFDFNTVLIISRQLASANLQDVQPSGPTHWEVRAMLLANVWRLLEIPLEDSSPRRRPATSAQRTHAVNRGQQMTFSARVPLNTHKQKKWAPKLKRNAKLSSGHRASLGPWRSWEADAFHAWTQG